MRIFCISIFFLFVSLNSLTGQSNCALPSITSSTGEGIYCTGDIVTLSIDGSLGDATHWQWSAGTCGQNIVIGATGNSITVQVTSSISYFVRGVGGCVPADAACHEIEITLDDLPPTPSCSDDVMVMASPGETESIVDYTIPGATDNCPGGVKIELVEGIKSGGVFPLGTTTVTYRFTDARGNTTTCSFDVTVKEGDGPTGPMITCPEDITVDADPAECGAIVNYQIPATLGDGVAELITGLGSGSFFPIGTTTETYTVTDASGNSMNCSFKIIVEENGNQPPVITLSKNSLTIWPPDHRKVTIQIEDYVESVSGDCDIGVDDVVITKVTSDEELNGTGDGTTEDDIDIASNCRSVDLRAERQGNGNGRVYTIHLAVAGLNGNTYEAEIKALVPHDHSGKRGNFEKQGYSKKGDDHEDEKDHDHKDRKDKGWDDDDKDDDDRDDDDKDDDDRDDDKDDDDRDDDDKDDDGKDDDGKGDDGKGDDDDKDGKDNDDREKDRKKENETTCCNDNTQVIDDGPKHVVQGCEPEVPPAPQAPPVFYTYVDNEEEVLTPEITPYPNPFNNTLEVRYTATWDEPVSLVLYDVRGVEAKQLFRGELNADQTYHWRFDLDALERKVYVMVMSGKHTYITKKLIKN